MSKSELKLYEHQRQVIDYYKENNLRNAGIYLKMGYGKTIIALELAINVYKSKKIRIVCPKNVMPVWIEHLNKFYPDKKLITCSDKNKNKNKNSDYDIYLDSYSNCWRDKNAWIDKVEFDTLILDESSAVSNTNSKQSKYLLKRKKFVYHVILLNGTPAKGRYENYYGQLRFLGWDGTKSTFLNNFCHTRIMPQGFQLVLGYKNTDNLFRLLKQYGAVFFNDLPAGIKLPSEKEIINYCDTDTKYRYFRKHNYINTNVFDSEGIEHTLEMSVSSTCTKRLYERMLCGALNKNKIDAFRNVLDQTENERLIVFYEFKEDFKKLLQIVIRSERPISIVNGERHDLKNYESEDNSVTFIQYKAGGVGLNLEKAFVACFFTPPEGAQMFAQSKGRIARVTSKTDFVRYIYLICRNSVEELVLDCVKKGMNFEQQMYDRWNTEGLDILERSENKTKEYLENVTKKN